MFGCCNCREGEAKPKLTKAPEAKPVVRGVIGIVFGQYNPAKAEFHVDKINPGSAAAEHGGVGVGDILVDVDGTEIKSAKVLVGRIKGAAGQPLTLSLRDAATGALKLVTLERRPADESATPTPTPSKGRGRKASTSHSITHTPRTQTSHPTPSSQRALPPSTPPHDRAHTPMHTPQQPLFVAEPPPQNAQKHAARETEMRALAHSARRDSLRTPESAGSRSSVHAHDENLPPLSHISRGGSESPHSAATTVANTPLLDETPPTKPHTLDEKSPHEIIPKSIYKSLPPSPPEVPPSVQLAAGLLLGGRGGREPPPTPIRRDKESSARRGGGGDAPACKRVQGGDAAVRALWHEDSEGDEVFSASALGQGMHEQHKALHWAARYGHVPTIMALVRAGVDLDVPSEDLTTPVMRAARFGHAAAIQELVKCGASVDFTDTGGCTALMWAARAGRLAAVRALLQCNASPDVQSESGWTAMMLAADNWQTEVVSLLVESGADVHMTNSEGQTALQIAVGNARRMACVDDVVEALQ